MSQLERKKRRTKHLLHGEVQCVKCNDWFKPDELVDNKCWRHYRPSDADDRYTNELNELLNLAGIPSRK
jgi:hypothetical protein